jgi:ribonuclease III
MTESYEKIKGRIEKKIGYTFNDADLLVKAMTHSSYANERKNKVDYNNERLEFLGDSVLSLIVSQYLFENNPDKKEGDLTKARAKLVCELTLSKCSRKISLGEFIILGKGEEMTGGRERNSILADAFEALIAAIYLDGGYDKAKAFVLSRIVEYVDDALEGRIIQDYKTYLQEVIQVKKGNQLDYKLVGTSGPDHCKEFFVEVILNDSVIGTGIGKSKKDAEQEAAKSALSTIEADMKG